MNPVAIIFLIAACFLLSLSIVISVDNSYKVITFKKQNVTLPRSFTVTAHTGCLKTRPNTTDSMSAGTIAGADIIEFDLRFNERGEPVLCHDKVRGSEVTLEKAFEFLNENKKTRANIDLKETSKIAKINELAEKYGVTGRIFFTGVSLKDVSVVERTCPNIPFYLNYNVNRRGKHDIAYISHIVETVENCGAVGINMCHRGASRELVDAFHEAGLYVSLWTVDTVLDLCEALKLSPDNITTRYPDRLLNLMKKYQIKKG